MLSRSWILFNMNSRAENLIFLHINTIEGAEEFRQQHTHSSIGKMSLCLPWKCMEEIGYTPVSLKSTAHWSGQHHVPTALPRQKAPWIGSWVILVFRQPSASELTWMKHVYTNAVTNKKQIILMSLCCILYSTCTQYSYEQIHLVLNQRRLILCHSALNCFYCYMKCHDDFMAFSCRNLVYSVSSHPDDELLHCCLHILKKITLRGSSISETTGYRVNVWGVKLQQGWGCFLWCRLRLKCYGTRAENRFCLSAKRTSPFKSAGASVQSTTGSRGVRISGSNAGYTMFRGSVKGTGYPLHSPVSPHFPFRASPCAITFQLNSTSRHGSILNMHWVIFTGSMAASVWSHTPRSTVEMKNLKHMLNYKLNPHNTINHTEY